MIKKTVELCPETPTFRGWAARMLTADDHRVLCVPTRRACGFITFMHHCKVFYLMGSAYDPALAYGIRWNDPVFAIDWLLEPRVISERDAGYPDFDP